MYEKKNIMNVKQIEYYDRQKPQLHIKLHVQRENYIKLKNGGHKHVF